MMRAIPKLVVSKKIEQHETYHPDNEYKLHYHGKNHSRLPHIVKFSGGRSSGMLLFTLLKNNILKAERGDVIVFNNTSAEHPDTYDFIKKCKRTVEEEFGIPFFWIEFQTYEDARKGEWRRIPTYRLVNPKPFSLNNPDGYHWKGEVFEELLSLKGYVPNQFSRICTVNMKLAVTRLFLTDWLAAKESNSRLGHYGNHSRIDFKQMYERHLKDGGEVPRKIYEDKKAYLLTRPLIRPSQNFKDFSMAKQTINNPLLEGKVFGGKAWLGSDGIEYMAFVGLRGDERIRVARMQMRNSSDNGSSDYGGEHVYAPLADMAITKQDVVNFWKKQPWDLAFTPNSELSNCVFCFLKGKKKLAHIYKQMEDLKSNSVTKWKRAIDTPADINWWIRLEKKYGRDLQAEKRKRRNKDVNFLGFFGYPGGLSYEIIATNKENETDGTDSQSYLPCDCTD